MKKLVFAIVVGITLVAFSHGSSFGQDLKPQEEGEIVSIDVRTPAFEPTESTARTVWQHEFTDWPGSASLRLRFGDVEVPEGVADGLVELLIQDRSGAVVERFSGRDLEALAGRWSVAVPGDYALISLVAPQPPVGLALAVDAVARTTSPGVSLSIISKNDLQPISAYEHDPFIVSLARPVAKLSFVVGDHSYVCSGFLISDDLLMTNEHCVNSDATCLTTVARFGYQTDSMGVPRPGAQYRCTELVAVDYELDMALLRLERSPGKEWGVLQVADEAPSAAEPMLIIQHPGGRPKMISINECAVTLPVAPGRGQDTDIAHGCDTEGGSSGSPVINTSGKVIGLHHFGVGQGAFWNQNRGVRMALIMQRVLVGVPLN